MELSIGLSLQSAETLMTVELKRSLINRPASNPLICRLSWMSINTRSGRRELTFKVANNAADHNQLLLYLLSLSGRTRVALEPTGDFHRPLAFRLLQAGFEVVSISSVAQARFREARYGTWDKNDPKDARVILAMLPQGLVQTYYDPLFHGTHDWQELSNTYYQVTLARTRLQHSLLLHYLPLYFPEFGRYWYSTRSEWFIRFLIRFPLPSSVRALTRDDFIKEAWDIVGNKWDKRAKLEEIYELAASSIGPPVDLNSPAVETFRLQLERYAEIMIAVVGWTSRLRPYSQRTRTFKD